MDDIGSMNSAAGYTLVRRLGSGRRADVFLGRASAASAAAVGDIPVGNTAAPPGGQPERSTTAAIKLFRPGTDRAGIDAEIGALARASSRHLLRLDDLATAPDGLPVLVLGLLRAQSLAHMLASRGRMGPGEAVTILAPIADAVAELHRVGVAHGGVRARSVLFDELGAPVLASFGRARIIGDEPAGTSASSLSPAELAGSAQALRDLADLATLATAVLESTPESAERTMALSFLRSAVPARTPERFAADLVGVLFDSATASPVVFGVTPRDPARPRGPLRELAGPASGIRSEAAPEPPAAATASAVRGRRRTRPAWLDAIHLPEWLEQVIRAAVPPRTVGSAVARVFASVRRPVWVAAASVAVLLTAALVLVPGGDSSSGVPEAGADPPRLPEAGAGPLAPPGAVVPGEGVPKLPVPEHAAVAGDDPVAASLALLELRDGCLASLSVLCLDDIEQAGSAAWEADTRLIRQAQEGGGAAARPVTPAGAWDGRSATLVERIGDSALVAVSPPTENEGEVPVSVLLIKGDEGWSIRDLFVG